MTEAEIKRFIRDNYPKEDEANEWKGYKSLKNDFNGKEKDDVTSYVSALANMEGGNLVIGVEDKTFELLGLDTYNHDVQKARLRLISLCTNLPSEGLRIEEMIAEDTKKKVWIITVPKHQCRLPVYAHSHAYQRVDDSLVELQQSRLATILSETISNDDWSEMEIPQASIEDLDPLAISEGRARYTELHPDKATEIRSWDDATFLNKIKATKKGKITTTAIILFGRSESEHFLSPAVCKIRWILKDGDIENKDFHIYTIPMILAVKELTSKIRNTTYTYTIEGNIFPEPMPRYDIFTLREPLCNAIAHQDYSKCARIEVIEYEDDKLRFHNYGQFLPSSVENVVENDCPESRYRNGFLVEAMRNVKMVETEGGGIKKLFVQQRKRFFPMPTYDLSNGQVDCTIEGRILDENFAKILANNPNMTLSTIMLLDRVQKHKPITEDALKYLRKNKFVEGRKNNIYLSASVVSAAKHVGLKTSYIKNKSFDDKYFKKLIIEYITKFKKAKRQDINILLGDKLPDNLTEEQKFDKITNLLASLRKSNIIKVSESRCWILVS